MSSWEEFFLENRGCPPGEDIDLSDCHTYCLLLRSVEGFKPSLLPSLSPDTPSDTSHRQTRKNKDLLRLDKFSLRVHLFERGGKQFLGRSWVSPPFRMSPVDNKSICSLGFALYFQLPDIASTYFVVEFVTKTNSLGSADSDTPVFWTSFDHISNSHSLPDLSTPSRHSPLRFPLFYGSPRSLFFLKNPLLDSKSSLPVPGCLLICSLARHRFLECAAHLFPPFYLLSSSSPIPGLVSSRQRGRDPLSSPKLLETLPCHVSELSIELSLDFPALSQQILSQLRASSEIPARGDARVSEMKLRVGIHNGLTFVHPHKILYLERDRQNEQSLKAIGSLQLEDLVQHPLLSLLFQLDILIQIRGLSSPAPSPSHSKQTLRRKQPSEARSDSFQLGLTLSWGSWSPFSSISPPPDEPVCVGFRLRGGPGLSPYNAPVWGGKGFTAHIRFYFTYWPQQVEEDGRLKRSLSSVSVQANSTRGQLPRRSQSQTGGKAFKKRNRPLSPPMFGTSSSSATPPLPHYDTAPRPTFESTLLDSNIRGGSVPHLNRMQDSSYHSTPVTLGAKRSSSCLTYTSLSRMHNVASTATPDTQVETSAIHTAEDQNPDLSINDASVQTNGQYLGEDSALQARDFNTSPPGIVSRDHPTFVNSVKSQTPAFLPSTHPPIPPQEDPKQSLSRADYALLYNSGFSDAFPNEDSSHPVENNINATSQIFPDRICVSIQLMAFLMPTDSIQNILEGYASLAIIDAPKQLFCTYKLYRWAATTTPKLSLMKTASKTSKKHSPFLLTEEGASTPGYLSAYKLSSRYQAEDLVSYLRQYKIQFDLWDGKSLMLIGSGYASLRDLALESMNSTQAIKEIEITSLDVFSSNDVLVLDQNGQFCHSQGRAVHQGNLVVRFAYLPDYDVTQINSFEHMYTLPPTNFNPITSAAKRQTDRESRRVSKAKHMVDTDASLCDMLHSFRETATNSKKVGKESSRKLERMKMVRGSSSLESLLKVDGTKRKKDFQILDLCRKDNKMLKIDSLLADSICSEATLEVVPGIAYFLEYELKNPFSANVILKIDIPDQSLTVIAKSSELKFLKNVYNSLTPREDDLIHFDDDNVPQIFLQPNESVCIPFKYQAFNTQTSPSNSTHQDYLKIPVKFTTTDNKTISVFTLKLSPQPVITEYSVHFYHPERIFFKKTFLISSSMFSPNSSDHVSAICSDKNVFAVVNRNDVADSVQLHLKFACENQRQSHTFFLFLYSNQFLYKPAQTWEISIHPLARIDINCTIGQSSYTKVYLKGATFTRVAQAFSSHPHVVQTQPKKKFVLPANSMVELNLGVKPTFIGDRNMCVNVVDCEMSHLIQQWMICIHSQQPTISRSYHIVIPANQPKASIKKIAFKNPYHKKRQFFLHCSRKDLLTFKEDSFQVNGLASHTIFLQFQPLTFNLDIDILVFINDKRDNTEECFCVQVSYQTL